MKKPEIVFAKIMITSAFFGVALSVALVPQASEGGTTKGAECVHATCTGPFTLLTGGVTGCNATCGGTCNQCAGSTTAGDFCQSPSSVDCNFDANLGTTPCGAKTQFNCTGIAPNCTCGVGAGVPNGNCSLTGCA